MKHKLWKKLSVTLVALLSLTSCKLIDNIVNRILLTAADQLPFLVNVIDLMAMQEGGGEDLPITQFDDPPLHANKRANINYITNALLIPKKLEVSGIPYNLEFSLPESGVNGFHQFVLTNEDLPAEFQEEIPLQLEVYVLIPVGTSTILGNASSLEDLEGVMNDTSQTELASAANQESIDVELPITIRAGANHSKLKTFYLKLVKAEFGTIIVDVVFDSDFLLNIYDAVNDEITSLEDKPEAPEQSVNLEYFKETLAIPKSIEIEDIGTVNFEVETNYPELFFRNNLEKTIEELDPNNEDFSGNIEIFTFTPVGTNDIPNTVQSIEDFKTYVEDTLGPKELYNKATSQGLVDNVTFTIRAFEEGGEEPLREETYYFRLIDARLEQEIVDYVMDDTEFVVNIINYKNVDNPKQLASVPDSPSNAANVSYLTETIVIPKYATLPDFGNKLLEFDTVVTSTTTEIFEDSRMTQLESDEVSDVTVTTLTPLANFIPNSNNVDDLADEIGGLGAKELYSYVTHVNTTLEIEVTAKMFDDVDNVYKTNTKTYYFNLVEANVDEEISDHIIDENALINIVEDYEDTDTIKGIASAATNPNNRYEVEHLKQTLIIPKEIVLPEYGNKTINVTRDVTEISGLLDPNFFIASESREVEENNEVFDLTVNTLTPLGSYINQGAVTLDDLADELTALPTKDLYGHSQHVDMEIDITLTLELGEETRSKTYYFKLIKADFDEKISKALMDPDIADIVYVGSYDFTKVAVSKERRNPATPLQIEYLRDTILVPTVFEPADYPNKTFEFVLDYNPVDVYNNDQELFYTGEKDDIQHEGNDITVAGLFPTSGFSKIHDYQELEALLNYISELFQEPPPVHLLPDAILLAQHIATLNDYFDFALTITPKIDGVLYSQHAATYYFDIVKPAPPQI